MRVPPVKINFSEDDQREIAAKLAEVLSSGRLTLGTYGQELEQQYAALCGTKHAVAVSSGTAALEIALRALNVAGKKVIVPTNTFIATAAAAIRAGAELVLADVDPGTLCLSTQTLRQACAPARAHTDDTAAAIVVHIGGIIPGDIREMRRFCDANGIALVEDACHAHGCSLNGQAAGSFGQAGCFSFYPTKVMTSAEGGMLVTDSDEIAAEARIYRDQGKSEFQANLHTRLGYSWRLSEPHAILGLAQLARLEEFKQARQAIARRYDQALPQIAGLTPIQLPAGLDCTYYKYIALLEPGLDRAQVKSRLRADFEVSLTGEVYETPCHQQPVLKEMYGFEGDGFPAAEDVCARHICLPIFPGMTEAQVGHVLESLEKVITQVAKEGQQHAHRCDRGLRVHRVASGGQATGSRPRRVGHRPGHAASKRRAAHAD